jgi:hypothetical protein
MLFIPVTAEYIFFDDTDDDNYDDQPDKKHHKKFYLVTRYVFSISFSKSCRQAMIKGWG